MTNRETTNFKRLFRMSHYSIYYYVIMTTQQNAYILGIAAVVAAVIGGFYIGMRFQVQRTSPFARPYWGTSRGGMMRGRMGYGFGIRNGMMGAGALTGQITSITANQMTVTFANGTTTTVLLSPNTTYTKLDPATQATLKSGEMVSITGSRDANGTLSAQTVRVNLPPATPTPTP